jgi:hypothetical protein
MCYNTAEVYRRFESIHCSIPEDNKLRNHHNVNLNLKLTKSALYPSFAAFTRDVININININILGATACRSIPEHCMHKIETGK